LELKTVFKNSLAYNSIWLNNCVCFLCDSELRNFQSVIICSYILSIFITTLIIVIVYNVKVVFEVSISPSFYKQLFLYNIVLWSFSLVTHYFYNFCQKEIGEKSARKMLVKLTTGVNFTSILLMTFLHKSVLRSFSLNTLWLWNFVSKAAPKMLVNWLQVSISPTLHLWLFCTKVFCAAFLYIQFGFVIFCPKNFGAKAAHKCWWNWLWVSISPTFYEQICCQ